MQVENDVEGKKLDAKLNNNADPSQAPTVPNDVAQHPSKAEAAEKPGHLSKDDSKPAVAKHEK